MVERLKSFFRFVGANFAPLVVFYAANHFFGLRAAVSRSCSRWAPSA